MQIVDILGLLVPNIWTALTQLCATAVLFFLMYKLAYKPVKNILDKRSEFVREIESNDNVSRNLAVFKEEK